MRARVATTGGSTAVGARGSDPSRGGRGQGDRFSIRVQQVRGAASTGSGGSGQQASVAASLVLLGHGLTARQRGSRPHGAWGSPLPCPRRAGQEQKLVRAPL
jgi:hypothetical protein